MGKFSLCGGRSHKPALDRRRLLMSAPLRASSPPAKPSGMVQGASVDCATNDAFGKSNVLDVLAMACGKAMELETAAESKLDLADSGSPKNRLGSCEGKGRFYLERHRLVEKR